MDTKRICLWSGPRNVSTALMYSFAQRSDTSVVDEPLYGVYLSSTGLSHPGADVILGAMQHSGEKVVQDDILREPESSVWFVKSMAHHLIGMDWSFLDMTTNVILTRDPFEMLPSLINQIPEPILRDTALPSQIDLLELAIGKNEDPIVLDARELLLDPEGVLRQLCERLDLEFESRMLQWEASAKEYDGVWAPFWYHNVHKSTGFAEYRRKTDPFPDRLKPLLAEAAPLYDKLYAHALKAER